MPDFLKEIAERTKRSMSHEAGHALTAQDYGFGADEFLIDVANDPTGATYRGVLDFALFRMKKSKRWTMPKSAAMALSAPQGRLGNLWPSATLRNRTYMTNREIDSFSNE
jgi:hypothetical protein